jgi:hypothetical protein
MIDSLKIEATLKQSHPAIEGGQLAAIQFLVKGEHKLVILLELTEDILCHLNFYELVLDICQSMVQYETFVDAILLLRTHTIPKNSNGEINYQACLTKFFSNTLDVIKDWTINPCFKSSFRHLIEDIELIEKRIRASKTFYSIETYSDNGVTFQEQPLLK